VKDWLRRACPLFAVIIGVVVLASCDEKLEGGAACPALCPIGSASVRDTTFFAVDVDSSIPGYPSIGTEPWIVLATLGDTFDARGIVRYDTLPTHYFARTGGDSVIRDVDSAQLTMHLANFDTLRADSVRFEVYDVDAAGDDTAAATLLPAFNPARLLGAKTVSFTDSTLRKDSTVIVPLDSSKIRARIQQDTAAVGPPRIRVGIRVTAATPVTTQLLTTNSSSTVGAQLSFVPALDSGTGRISIQPRSMTPTIDAQLRSDLADFQIVAKPLPPPGPDALRVGGVPGWRTYLHFAIPPSIVDSSDIIRATLFVTQKPRPDFPEAKDTMWIASYAMTASTIVTAIDRLLTFITPSGDSIRLVPKDSGVKIMEVVNIIRPWRGTDPARTPRAIALSATFEGGRTGAVEFYSNEAPPSVRPALRLTYVPRVSRGLP
jgi:hypothetical protein